MLTLLSMIFLFGVFIYFTSIQSPAAIKTHTEQKKYSTDKVIVIDDYSKFVEDCFNEPKPKVSKNPQKERMKEKQIAKRRKRNKMAKESRKTNRK